MFGYQLFALCIAFVLLGQNRTGRLLLQKMTLRHVTKRHRHAVPQAQPYLPSAERGRRLSRPPHETQSLLEVLVPEFHFSPLTPHSGQVIHVLQLNLSGLVKDDTGIDDVAMTLVELGKGDPQCVGFAYSLQSGQKLVSKKKEAEW